LLVAALYVAVLLSVGAALAAFRYLPALDDARALRAEVEALGADLEEAGLAIDRPRLDRVEADAARARGRLERVASLVRGDPLVALAGVFPPTADDVRGAQAVVSAAEDVFDAVDSGLSVLDRYVAIREAQQASPEDVSTLALMVELMATTREPVASAAASLATARETLSHVPTGLAGPIENARAAMVSRIDAYGPLVERYVDLSAVLPEILGWDEPRRYLVLAQNPAELRATGGFIGTYGLVGFDKGRITEREFQDVYLLDNFAEYPHVEPPEALVRYMLGEGRSWGLRDSNWSPDFPTSAQDALRLYEIESRDTTVDGVLGITTYTIDELLRLTGPLSVPDYDVTIAPGETTLKALQLTRNTGDPDVNRKAFLSALADELLPTLLALPPDRWNDIFDAAPKFQSQRLLLAWFTDPAHQRLASSLGINGAVRQDAGDYVFPVESNVRPATKLHAIATRSLTLSVELDADGNARHELEISWHNPILEAAGAPYRALPPAGRRDLGMYFRLLVPSESSLESATMGDGASVTGDTVRGTEAGRAVLANYLRIPPGATALRYEWLTPSVVESTPDAGEYRLIVQKQPGLLPPAITVAITVPDGYHVTSASDPITVSGETARFTGTLDRDLELVVEYGR
jgi:hypothetical protein